MSVICKVLGLSAAVLWAAAVQVESSPAQHTTRITNRTRVEISARPITIRSVEFLGTSDNGYGVIFTSPDTTDETHGQAVKVSEPGVENANDVSALDYGDGIRTEFGVGAYAEPTGITSRAWGWVCRLWVFAPIFGFVYGAPNRLSTLWWWTLASVLVVCVGFSQPVLRRCRFWSLLLAGVLGLYLLHFTQGLFANGWLVNGSFAVLAAGFIYERGHRQWLIQAVIISALLQVPIIIFQMAEIATPWGFAGGGFGGSMGKRSACAALLGFASVCMISKRSSTFLALATLLTQSMMGLPALIRCYWMFARSFGIWALILPFSTAFFTYPLWKERVLVQSVLSRLHVWSGTRWIQDYWAKGYGFHPFPSGYQDETTLGLMLDWRFMNSAFVDFGLRAGAIGVLILLALFIYMTRRVWGTNACWALAMIVWVGAFQSIEFYPALNCLFLVFLINVCPTKEESENVSSLHKVEQGRIREAA